MINFLSGCASLFTNTFNVACGMDFFEFLAGVLLFLTAFAVFQAFSRGLRKM